ncbi:MAG: T9SS type A sorting domain-containing protein [Lewinella sp.]|nr:T9SS type A sorting domain-containing protein [Lewinella sp.]
MQYDFRDIYGSVFQDWFGLPAAEVSRLLGHDFVHLPVLRPCGIPTAINEPFTDLQADLYPNPTAGQLQISFGSNGSFTDLSVFDNSGRRLQQVFARTLNTGPQRFSLDLSGYPAGAYHVRLQAGNRVLSRRVVKE